MCLAYGGVGPSLVSDDIDAKLFLEASAISFGLFLLNVVVIFIVGVLFFKFKVRKNALLLLENKYIDICTSHQSYSLLPPYPPPY